MPSTAGERRDFQYFLLISSLIGFSSSLWTTLLPLYLDEAGLKAWEIGFISGLMSSLSFMLAFTAGVLADVFSWAVALLTSEILQLASIGALPLARDLALTSLVAVLYGSSRALVTQAGVRVIVDRSSLRRRGTMYALFLFSEKIARLLGSYSSGFIVENAGYNSLFQLAALTLAVSVAVTTGLVLKGEGRSRGTLTRAAERFKENVLGTFRAVTRSKELTALSISIFLHDASVFIAAPYMLLYVKHVLKLGEAAAGIISGTKTATSLVFHVFSGWVGDVAGYPAALTTHFALASLSYAAYGHTRDFWEALLVSAFMGFMITLDLPSRRMLAARYAPLDKASSVAGFIDSVAGVGAILSPVLGGYLWDINPYLPFITAAAANLTAIPPMIYLAVRQRKRGKCIERNCSANLSK